MTATATADDDDDEDDDDRDRHNRFNRTFFIHNRRFSPKMCHFLLEVLTPYPVIRSVEPKNNCCV